MSQVFIEDIMAWLNEQLQPDSFRDYAPNGLQVQGRREIKKIVCGVTASLALVEQAVSEKADAIIVHHGWFWKNENSCITGSKYKRVSTLIKNDINLIGYHLPLDAHPEYGNNACLANMLDLNPLTRDGKPYMFGDGDLIWMGEPKQPGTTARQLADLIEERLQRRPLFIGQDDQVLRRVAWCTGGAQGFLEAAINEGADAYITGEASEQVNHLALENGVAYYGAGHHATERYGVQALGDALKRQFPDLEIKYIEVPNPV